MALFDNVKPFWPLLFTFVLPRALGYYQALKTAYRTRPPPRPIPAKASRALKILLCSTMFFLWLSVSTNKTWGQHRNVFARTQTRLHVPTDVLFARLASVRPNGVLSAQDEELRLKLLTVASRQIYLRYGPSTILNCPFCHPDTPVTYLLHYLPTNVLLFHLIHLVTVGLATSRSVSGLTASKFRTKAIAAAAIFLLLDIYIVTTIDLPISTPSNPSPQSLYVGTYIGRPFSLAIGDLILAFLIYITATSRFIFFPFLASASAATDGSEDPEELLRQTDKLLNETGVALQMAHMKLRGLNIAKNAVVRDEGLKRVDERYWETVRLVEGEDGRRMVDESVFEDEEVQAAMAKAFGSGSVDVERMRREAQGFVDNVTRGLERPSEN